MYYESTLVQVVQKVVVHKQFFRQSHCFTYIVILPLQYGDLRLQYGAVTCHDNGAYCTLAMQPCPAALPGSLARQPCPAALPGSLARQPCPAALPDSLAQQPCPAALTGSLARQPCPAALHRQPCPAALQKYYSINNRPEAGRIASFLTAVGRQFIASFPCK
jgi:hypothetical protein